MPLGNNKAFSVTPPSFLDSFPQTSLQAAADMAEGSEPLAPLLRLGLSPAAAENAFLVAGGDAELAASWIKNSEGSELVAAEKHSPLEKALRTEGVSHQLETATREYPQDGWRVLQEADSMFPGLQESMEASPVCGSPAVPWPNIMPFQAAAVEALVRHRWIEPSNYPSASSHGAGSQSMRSEVDLTQEEGEEGEEEEDEGDQEEAGAKDFRGANVLPKESNEFQANVMKLVELGTTPEQAAHALEATNNDVGSAAALILGDL